MAWNGFAFISTNALFLIFLRHRNYCICWSLVFIVLVDYFVMQLKLHCFVGLLSIRPLLLSDFSCSLLISAGIGQPTPLQGITVRPFRPTDKPTKAWRRHPSATFDEDEDQGYSLVNSQSSSAAALTGSSDLYCLTLSAFIAVNLHRNLCQFIVCHFWIL